METLEELYEFYLQHGVRWSQGETPLNFENWKEVQEAVAMWELVKELIKEA
tara:strand:- start:1167 stop:1319 length:153 start_codon:yes stop_codon:yes gene_type:complete